MRSKQQNEKEKHIVDYIKKLDQKIKKLEKEEKNLDKILNEDKSGNLLRKQEEDEAKKGEKKEHFAGAYLRSQRLLAPILVSEKVQQQIDIIMGELEIIPTSLTPTDKTLEMYDEIRKEILKMLSLHKHIKKRKEEIAILNTRLVDLKDFATIASTNPGVVARAQPMTRNPPPQVGSQHMPASARPPSGVAEKTPATNARGAKAKSPAKESKPPAKASGKKRKAAGSQGGGSKRSRNN